MQSAMKSKVDKVLNSLVQHMTHSHEHIEALGANCNNTHWDDFTQGIYHRGQTVGDMMRCRYVTLALYYANGWDAGGNNTDEETAQPNTQEQTMNERLRCELANTFGSLLRERYCTRKQTWNRGVEYAWNVMTHIGSNKYGGQTLLGPVMDGRCTLCGYKGSWTQRGIINGDIAQWLVDQGIMTEIAHIEQQMPCEKDWKKYKEQMGGTDNKVIEEAKIPEVKQIEKKVVEETQQVIEKVKDKIDQEIAKADVCSHDGSVERAAQRRPRVLTSVGMVNKYTQQDEGKHRNEQSTADSTVCGGRKDIRARTRKQKPNFIPTDPP
ncbi:hypothetical protein AK88_01368 [Plasmodium fragile]|uniref:Schizont-infected cell agglutination extracellular alpha domain-containing protein n=1 Tax=Plasmodium fragile TaxID=5857 RepID=A0A0D9QP91_PLAFR|nr:uncharacterized protein AK88_01368 [Plasmodium fragile]KJP88874.1 hypothetical protein AK88_01368 [Plasmodium fragile]